MLLHNHASLETQVKFPRTHSSAMRAQRGFKIGIACLPAKHFFRLALGPWEFFVYSDPSLAPCFDIQTEQ